MTLQQLIADIPLLLAYVICIACLVQLFVIFFVERINIVADLRGPDKQWQFLELTGLMWLVLFPTVVVVSLFGVEVAGGVWTSMDAIYFMNIGGKIGHKWMDKLTKEKPTKNEQV